MLYSLKGKLLAKKEHFVIIETGGTAFKVGTTFNVLRSLPPVGEIINLFTHLHVREDALELFGFLTEEELEFFEMLINISGIGPKSAVGILGVENIAQLKAAISEGRSELLTKASGIGKRTADRIILELGGKLKQAESAKIADIMESDQDILEALVNLGYARSQAREALAKVDSKIIKTEERIKAALKSLRS